MRAVLDDRLSRLSALRPAHTRSAVKARSDDADESEALARLVGATVGGNRYGEHLVVRRWYSSPEPCVPSLDAVALLASPEAEQSTAARACLADPEQWLFLDTETTGLAGGTGTYAFLVGLAWWETGGLQVEQLFMRDHGEEHSLLLELAHRLARRRVLVTFNGKSFDWPLLETRFALTRAIAPRPPLAHLDLLHPARQLWRLRLGSVRLTELERHVLVRTGPGSLDWDRRYDIGSALIPQIYFDYLRGGPVQPVASVFRHNQMDLRGLAALAGKLLALLSGLGAGGEAEEACALDLYGLSRLLHRRGESARARSLYERALAAGLPGVIDRAARRELARLAKRERDFARATQLWGDLLGEPTSFVDRERNRVIPCPPKREKDLSAEGFRSSSNGQAEADRARAANGIADSLRVSLEAYEQLAIYYEHHVREPQSAARLTREALAALRRALRLGLVDTRLHHRLQARFQHRLERLQRRLKTGFPRPLFERSPATRRRARESNQE